MKMPKITRSRGVLAAITAVILAAAGFGSAYLAGSFTSSGQPLGATKTIGGTSGGFTVIHPIGSVQRYVSTTGTDTGTCSTLLLSHCTCERVPLAGAVSSLCH